METERNFDFSETPEDLLLPPHMFFNWEITKLEVVEAVTNKTMCNVCGVQKGKTMLVVTYTVLEPVDYKDASVRENYVIGIDTDPCAHEAKTLAGRVMGAVNFNLLLGATQTPKNQMRTVVGKRCQRSLLIVEIDDTKTGGKRSVNNFERGIYPVGTVPVGQPTASSGGRGSGGNGGSQRPAQQQSMVPCPRCKKEFSSTEIDDHVAECSMS